MRYQTRSAPWIVRDPGTRDDLILQRGASGASGASRGSGSGGSGGSGSADGRAGGGAQSREEFERKHRRADAAVTVRAEEMLELNVSSAFCQSLSSVLETVQKLQTGLATNDGSNGAASPGSAEEGASAAPSESAASATTAALPAESSYHITMHNCTGRAIEFSAAQASDALARNARRRAPYRFFKAFVDTQQPGRAALLHAPALTNGRDELSASAGHNAVTVDLGHAVVLELQASVWVRSLSVAAGDALRGDGAPKLLDVYRPAPSVEDAAAGGVADAWEAEPRATLQYSSGALRDDAAFRAAQVFDLDLSLGAPVQRLKIVVREAWRAGDTAVTLRQLGLYTTAGASPVERASSPVDGRSSPLLPLPSEVRAAKRSSVWQHVDVAELAALPVAASVRAYGATDLPLQQSLPRSVYVRAGGVVERGSGFAPSEEDLGLGADSTVTHAPPESWVPAEINVDSEFDKVVDLARRAFHVQIISLHGVEFKSNVKVHVGLVAVGSAEGGVTQEQKHGASALHDPETHSLVSFLFTVTFYANRAHNLTRSP